MQMKSDSFWARANEEAFASHDFFQDIEKTFATGRGKIHTFSFTFLIILFLTSLSLSSSSSHPLS